MGSPPPPDPYVALGVPKDATTAAVKTAHRKLVLKCHPDKVADPALKQAASDKFHVIQSAYEILVDEDRRGRYDAQVRLAELRREALERKSSGGSRGYDAGPTSAPYRDSYGSASRGGPYSRDAERPAPTYEERRPPNYPTDYFDGPPRATTRKDSREADYERASRRPAHDSREKLRTTVKDAKDHMRAGRKEKDRKAEKDTRRDRDRKYAYAEAESDSEDEYAQWKSRLREADNTRRTGHDQERRYRQEAENGQFVDERVHKMYTQGDMARDYIQNARSRNRPDTDRRPSPVRGGSDKETAYAKRNLDRPAMATRQSSSRPTTSGLDAEPPRRSGRGERRPSLEGESLPRRPPPFVASKSSPGDIRLPTEKPRAQSLQHDADALPRVAHMKRAETMPYTRTESTLPTKGTNLRSTEVADGMPTPGATPEYPGASPTKYTYGKQYADDAEYPTPDGYRPAMAPEDYRTEYREPVTSGRPTFARRVTRSPSPVRDPRDARESREKPRAASSKYDAGPRPSLQASRGSSTRHVYSYSRENDGGDRRGSAARASTRDAQSPLLFAEIPSQGRPENIRSPTDSPRRSHGPYGPPEEPMYNTKDVRPGSSSRTASGYAYSSKRGDKTGPNVSRNGSQPIHVR